MKTRFIGILLVAAFLILSFPSGAAASHSFAHIIETLQNALLEVHRMFPSPVAPSDKFRMGDRVVAQSPHNARSDPLFSSWMVVGGAPAGTKGTVIDSSRTISGTTTVTDANTHTDSNSNAYSCVCFWAPLLRIRRS